jgi:hypothetical protein
MTLQLQDRAKLNQIIDCIHAGQFDANGRDDVPQDTTPPVTPVIVLMSTTMSSGHCAASAN